MASNYLQQVWQHGQLGQWLALALQRFDRRVLELMAANEQLPLALAHLARRGKLTAAHVQITRHLRPEGARLSELARRAQISKQAMGKLVDQCSAWSLVQRACDAQDRRAKRVQFTAAGLAWLNAYAAAASQAEDELRLDVGAEVAAIMALGLEAYAA